MIGRQIRTTLVTAVLAGYCLTAGVGFVLSCCHHGQMPDLKFRLAAERHSRSSELQGVPHTHGEASEGDVIVTHVHCCGLPDVDPLLDDHSIRGPRFPSKLQLCASLQSPAEIRVFACDLAKGPHFTPVLLLPFEMAFLETVSLLI